jgi:hypothetical protein
MFSGTEKQNHVVCVYIDSDFVCRVTVTGKIMYFLLSGTDQQNYVFCIYSDSDWQNYVFVFSEGLA